MVKVYIQSYFHTHTQSFHICKVRNALSSRATRAFLHICPLPSSSGYWTVSKSWQCIFSSERSPHREVHLQMRAEAGFPLGRCRAQLGAILLCIQGGGRWQDFQKESQSNSTGCVLGTEVPMKASFNWCSFKSLFILCSSFSDEERMKKQSNPHLPVRYVQIFTRTKYHHSCHFFELKGTEFKCGVTRSGLPWVGKWQRHFMYSPSQ